MFWGWSTDATFLYSTWIFGAWIYLNTDQMWANLKSHTHLRIVRGLLYPILRNGYSLCRCRNSSGCHWRGSLILCRRHQKSPRKISSSAVLFSFCLQFYPASELLVCWGNSNTLTFIYLIIFFALSAVFSYNHILNLGPPAFLCHPTFHSIHQCSYIFL